MSGGEGQAQPKWPAIAARHIEISIKKQAKEPAYPKLNKEKIKTSHGIRLKYQGEKKIPMQMIGKGKRCRTKGELKTVA